MEWASPLLHAAMNLHLSEDKEDKEDSEFWSKEGLLTEDQIDELWENGNATYWKWIDSEAPQICRDFYAQVGSLHDAIYDVLVKGETSFEVTLQVKKEDHSTFEINFNCDKLWSGQTAPDFFCSDGHILLYDEFHITENKLSYHFTSNNGKEWAFYGVQNMKWSQK